MTIPVREEPKKKSPTSSTVSGVILITALAVIAVSIAAAFVIGVIWLGQTVLA